MRAMNRQPGPCPRNRDPVGHGTIHTLPGLVLGDSVIFTSTEPWPGAGPRLAQVLLRELARLDPRWNSTSDEKAPTLYKSSLGEPCLLLGDKQGPSLSFSHGVGKLWAAMSRRGGVGIDAAYPEEFAGTYPFARAFRPEEMDYARALCHNDTARGAALIWAAKEASVKATGAGFNLFDPLDVRVGNPLFREQGIVFEVLVDRPILAWATTADRGWLSLALA